MDVRTIHQEMTPSTLTARLSKRLMEEFGHLQPGEKLPTGQELARRFGVSLTVVREAISSLRSEGLVETRQGSGAFICRSARQRPFRIESTGASASAVGPEQIFELRTGIEMQAAALAAERGTASQHRAIRKALDGMKDAVAEGRDGVAEDVLLHRRIAEAAGNMLFSTFLDFLGEHIRDSIAVSRLDASVWLEQQQHVMDEHAAIVDAIFRRDATAARRAAEMHMANCLGRCSKR